MKKGRLANWIGLFRNKYILTITLFFLWMTFFDNNDFFRQYKVYQKRQEMTRELNRRKALIKDTYENLNQLKDRKQLEKFAREQYLFKRPNEDIFVLVEENPNQ